MSVNVKADRRTSQAVIAETNQDRQVLKIDRDFDLVTLSATSWGGLIAADILNSVAVAETVERARSTFWDVVRLSQEHEPNWFPLTVLGLMRETFAGLRGCLETGKCSWSSPIAEFEIPMEWDWDAFSRGGGWSAGFVQFDAEDFRDAATLQSKMELLRSRYCNLHVLQSLTKRAAYLKRGKTIRYVMPEELQQRFASLEGEKQKQFVSWLYKPFYIGHRGSEEIDLTGLPPDVAESLKPICLPDFGEARGEQGAVSLGYDVFFLPLIIDEEKRQAFFRLRLALGFHGREHSTDPLPSDRDAIWNSVFKEFDSCISRTRVQTRTTANKADDRLRALVNKHHNDKDHQLLSDDRRALFERIKSLQRSVGFGVVEALEDVRNNG